MLRSFGSAKKTLPAFALFAALSSVPALAVATTYTFASGSATITATAGTDTIMNAVAVPLTGVFVEFDSTGNGSLDDFLITLGPTVVLELTTAYGGFDEVVIESADISPAPGFTNLFNLDAGGGLYNFLASPLDINGVYSASDSSGVNSPVSNVPVPFTDTSSINGSLNIILGTMELNGITLTSLPSAFFPGETDDLIVKADFNFTVVVPNPIPEPTTGVLVGLGLVIIGSYRQILGRGQRPHESYRSSRRTT